ncbi:MULTISPECIES: substrate-binding periplasmic protein [Pseudomonas syringae group]|uniref:ABC-type amino acid transport, signal transduction system, periplasmic component/domain protein n=1 Tax=Pseudomonas syringae pv. primulae TaxID=251707 RepID=A0A0Q0AQV5_9PSED|nr:MULTISPECIES: ABC transporter substrate-binding protein [Pseudomonas syringae group]KPY36285.1 ABC-type amino acid transport, signal transduction system, periplasmic component/domain protein [Pseudomonas syringae pv. primulae]MBD8188886.1 ABC transporter substrate-binding protein [Pseudomonas viridiflava]MBD8199828.1 ABC transporter substrate-binding protein [Pseudomonas viridiflava]MDY0937381.1 ABC transporter substrate-binding protein [Pseudomonas viridiflava]MDY1014963.1 ABC transporter 
MLKRLFLALVGAGVLLSEVARAGTSPAYSMVLLTENYPPYNMAADGKNFAQDSNINGIAVDVVREMFKRAGVGYNLTLRFPWERVYKLALEKHGYGVFSTVRTPERENLFKWVGPIGPVDWVLLAPANSTVALSSLEQARGYRIGAYKGDAVAEHLALKGLDPVVMLRDQDNARKLVSGQIDLWATADPVGLYLAKQEGITDLKTVLRFHTAELYLALNKDTPQDVVDRLQAALDKMRDEGKLKKINDRYL